MDRHLQGVAHGKPGRRHHSNWLNIGCRCRLFSHMNWEFLCVQLTLGVNSFRQIMRKIRHGSPLFRMIDHDCSRFASPIRFSGFSGVSTLSITVNH